MADNVGYVRGALIASFAVAIVLLGANEILKGVKETGKEKLTKDNVISVLHQRLTLDQGRLTKKEVEELKELRKENGSEENTNSLFNINPDEEKGEIK